MSYHWRGTTENFSQLYDGFWNNYEPFYRKEQKSAAVKVVCYELLVLPMGALTCGAAVSAEATKENARYAIKMEPIGVQKVASQEPIKFPDVCNTMSWEIN